MEATSLSDKMMIILREILLQLSLLSRNGGFSPLEQFSRTTERSDRFEGRYALYLPYLYRRRITLPCVKTCQILVFILQPSSSCTLVLRQRGCRLSFKVMVPAERHANTIHISSRHAVSTLAFSFHTSPLPPFINPSPNPSDSDPQCHPL